MDIIDESRDKTVDVDNLKYLDDIILESNNALHALQRDDGHWIFELEAESSISSEYILLSHYFDKIDNTIAQGIGQYLRRTQGSHGGWPLYHDGEFNISNSVKAYYALKVIGDDLQSPHMILARQAILAHGGPARCNVLTRYQLALFGQLPWRAVPVMFVEIMLLPRWFWFHLSKVSYWSRVVIVPLLILNALKPEVSNEKRITIRELFPISPEQERSYLINPTGSIWGELFLRIDRLLRWVEPFIPHGLRQHAIERAESFIIQRLNGQDGLGGIFPAIAGTFMCLQALGYPKDHEYVVMTRKALSALLVKRQDGQIYCQPCLSPVWDTVLTSLALIEAQENVTQARNQNGLNAGLQWLIDRQILDSIGDWAEGHKHHPRPGGWAFQYRNDDYPDVDDTAVVGMALHRSGLLAAQEAIDRTTEWILGMQSTNGGWAAFDIDNTYSYLDHIPFADHGALRDPPTSDVSARCLSFLAQIGFTTDHPSIKKGIRFLLDEQELDGSWFGRWGVNYIYGTWSVLSAFNALNMDHTDPCIRRAVTWLLSHQRLDGGWGEECITYWHHFKTSPAKVSNPSQTAWAVLALMAVGEVNHMATRRGIAFLCQHPRIGARWQEEYFTGAGFPRQFYLKYYGYAAYFPLLAIARYRNLKSTNNQHIPWGM